MVQLFASRRLLRAASLHVVALALCSVSIIASAAPASARPHHGMARYPHAHYHARYAGRYVGRHFASRHYRLARGSHWERGVATVKAEEFDDTNASLSPSAGFGDMAGSGGSSNVVAEARRYLGGNPTGRGSLWCARFMNLVLQHTGYKGTGSDMACFVRPIRPTRLRTSGRRDRRDGPARRRPCRHHYRHRCIGESDHDFGQQRQSGQGSADLARPDLRLRHADELRQSRALSFSWERGAARLRR